MSDISEHGVREAAWRLAKAIADDKAGEQDSATSASVYGTEDVEVALSMARQDAEIVVAWTQQELSRRDAEKAEREKPIDAEWCLANGATCDEWNSRFPMYEWLIGSQSVRWNPRRGVFMWCGGTSFVFDTITTRGQLLDLLRALRVGEE